MSSMRFKNSGRNSSRRARHGLLARLLRILCGELENRGRADVRRHDDHRVAKIDGAALAVGETAVVENLQQDVEDVRMRLFDFVEAEPPNTGGGAPAR